MATIGTFKKTGSNEFTGDIITLSVQAKGVRIIPDLRANLFDDEDGEGYSLIWSRPNGRRGD